MDNYDGTYDTQSARGVKPQLNQDNGRVYCILQYQPDENEPKELDTDTLHVANACIFLAVNQFCTSRQMQVTYGVVGPQFYQDYTLSQAQNFGISLSPYQDVAMIPLSEDDILALQEEKPPQFLAYYFIDQPTLAFNPTTVSVDLAKKYSSLLKDKVYDMPEGDSNNTYQQALQRLPKPDKKQSHPYADLKYNPVRWGWKLRTTSLRTRPDTRVVIPV